jgi:hypothetical protein
MAKFICENCKKEYIRKGNLDKHIKVCKNYIPPAQDELLKILQKDI